MHPLLILQFLKQNPFSLTLFMNFHSITSYRTKIVNTSKCDQSMLFILFIIIKVFIIVGMKDKKQRKRKHSQSPSNQDSRERHKHKSKHKKHKYFKKRDSKSEDSDKVQIKKQSADWIYTKNQQNNQNTKRKTNQYSQNNSQNDKPSSHQKDDGWQSQQKMNEKGGEKQVINQFGQTVEKNQKIKEKPNFQPSGILLQYYNSRQGVSLKFHEPTEAHKPFDEWRIYPFRDGTPVNPIILKQSCYLVGKDERVCDIICENSSVSRQHAVVQFRSQYKTNIEGIYEMLVKPYIMDLQSTNGTTLNKERLQPSRYYELLNKDILTFGLSQREYLIFKVPEESADFQQ